jgi:hypothetical protein
MQGEADRHAVLQGGASVDWPRSRLMTRPGAAKEVIEAAREQLVIGLL